MLFSLDVEQEAGGFKADHRLSRSPGPDKSILKKQGFDVLDHMLGTDSVWTEILELRHATLTLRFSYSAISDKGQGQRKWPFLLSWPFPSREDPSLLTHMLTSDQENQKVCTWRVMVLNRQWWLLSHGQKEGSDQTTSSHSFCFFLFVGLFVFVFWDQILLCSLTTLGFIILLTQHPTGTHYHTQLQPSVLSLSTLDVYLWNSHPSCLL